MNTDEYGTRGIISVILRTGREINAARCLVAATYANVLVGVPSLESDRRHIEDAPRRLRNVFGDWPVHIIAPELVRSSRGEAHLPIVEVAALFDSFAEDPQAAWTGLLLVWFQDSADQLISPHNRELISRVAWDALAKPFDF